MKQLPAFFGSLVGVAALLTIHFALDGLLLEAAVVSGVVFLGYVIAAATPRSLFGEGVRGGLIGVNAASNAVLSWLLVGGLADKDAGLLVGVALGAINYLAVFPLVSQTGAYQWLIGWLNWFLPMSWLITGLGLLFFLIDALGHVFAWWIARVSFFRVQGLRVDAGTGTFFQKGGVISNLNYLGTAFNMGNFAFVHRNSGTWHTDHESGHSLNLAAFGSVFHLIGAADENVLRRLDNAYAELIAESHASSAGKVIPMWT